METDAERSRPPPINKCIAPGPRSPRHPVRRNCRISVHPFRKDLQFIGSESRRFGHDNGPFGGMEAAGASLKRMLPELVVPKQKLRQA